MSKTYHCMKCHTISLIPGKCGECGGKTISSEELQEAMNCVLRLWREQGKRKTSLQKRI
jgi:DNA-directed RNA polymerase subunit RPC12/RpoP